jgi:hypothetical protein
VLHVTLKPIANNAEIDVIWQKWQAILGPLRKSLIPKPKSGRIAVKVIIYLGDEVMKVFRV